MAGFLYFIPGISPTQIIPKMLTDRGLDVALRDVLADWKPNENIQISSVHSKGPGGRTGSILYPIPKSGELPRTAGFNADQQEWCECKDGEYWVGYDKERRPTPTDLERPLIVNGHVYELGDGQHWTCPVIRQPVNRPGIPTAWGIDPKTGEFTENVLRQYQWAWELSAEIWEVTVGIGKMKTSEAFEICAQILSLNYRVSQLELSILNVITSTNYRSVFHASVNWPLIEELFEKVETDDGIEFVEKKTFDQAQELMNSSVGEKATTVSTDPAEQNSISLPEV